MDVEEILSNVETWTPAQIEGRLTAIARALHGALTDQASIVDDLAASTAEHKREWAIAHLHSATDEDKRSGPGKYTAKMHESYADIETGAVHLELCLLRERKVMLRDAVEGYKEILGVLRSLNKNQRSLDGSSRAY